MRRRDRADSDSHRRRTPCRILQDEDPAPAQFVRNAVADCGHSSAGATNEPAALRLAEERAMIWTSS